MMVFKCVFFSLWISQQIPSANNTLHQLILFSLFFSPFCVQHNKHTAITFSLSPPIPAHVFSRPHYQQHSKTLPQQQPNHSLAVIYDEVLMTTNIFHLSAFSLLPNLHSVLPFAMQWPLNNATFTPHALNSTWLSGLVVCVTLLFWWTTQSSPTPPPQFPPPRVWCLLTFPHPTSACKHYICIYGTICHNQPPTMHLHPSICFITQYNSLLYSIP